MTELISQARRGSVLLRLGIDGQQSCCWPLALRGLLLEYRRPGHRWTQRINISHIEMAELSSLRRAVKKQASTGHLL